MRKLTNALVAGQFTALLSTELLFLLNPEVPHTWTSVLSVFATFSITYGLAAGAAFWLLLSVAGDRSRRTPQARMALLSRSDVAIGHQCSPPRRFCSGRTS